MRRRASGRKSCAPVVVAGHETLRLHSIGYEDCLATTDLA